MKDINVLCICMGKPRGQFKLLYAFAIKVAVMYLRQVVIIVIVSTHNGNMGCFEFKWLVQPQQQ